MDEKLDGLQAGRAIAALSIAYFHSWVAILRFPKDTAFPLPILSNYGWIAVDFFFALSGFVICIVAARPKFDPLSFLFKRAFRLYPLWLLTLATFAGAALLWRQPRSTETLSYFIYSATLLPTRDYPFYDIGWSLQHELIFYLITAIIVPAVGIAGLAFFLAASFILGHLFELPWYLSQLASYHAEFLSGVLAFMARGRMRQCGVAIPLLAGIASLWVFTTWASRAYFPIALFFLITAFANVSAQRETCWLKFLSKLGDASYSIYLIHPILFLIVSAAVSRLVVPLWVQEPIRAASFVLLVAVSLASWNYFERPVISLANKYVARFRKHQASVPLPPSTEQVS